MSSPPWPRAASWARRCSHAAAAPSLAGQCCNVAVVMDFSKYMHAILELDPAQKFARVQPGIVLDRLRDAAEEHDLTFAPDPATHSRCTLGGMIGNNSCGVHALMGGKTVDNIEVARYPALRRHPAHRRPYLGSGTADHHRRRRPPRGRSMPGWHASGIPTAT